MKRNTILNHRSIDDLYKLIQSITIDYYRLQSHVTDIGPYIYDF